nr:helix-turn-helix domain-containing protein [Geomicrobium sediminis]
MMENEGITQQKLSDESGVSQATISSLMTDAEYRAKLSTEEKLKQALKRLGVKNLSKYF